MDQIELFNHLNVCKQLTEAKSSGLHSNTLKNKKLSVVKISATKLDDFIIKGFQTIVFIFIFTTFRSICPPREPSRNFELRPLLNLRELPFLIPLAITSVKYSWIVTRLQSVLNLQPPDNCLLREPTPINVTLCVLLDSSEWIFGTYKLDVLTWLGLLLLCMMFYLCSYSDFFSSTLFDYWFPYCIQLNTWSTQQVIVAQHMCWFLKASNPSMFSSINYFNFIP